MKQKIRLNESNLHRIVKESVKRILKENEFDPSQEYWEICDEIGEEEMCKLVTEWIGDGSVVKMVWNYCKQNDAFDSIVPWLKEHVL